MAYSLTPTWANMRKPQDTYGGLGCKTWTESFTATTVGTTERAVTRGISCKNFSGITLHVNNTSANALTSLKIKSGAALSDGDLTGLATNVSNILDAAFARYNSLDPTTLAGATEIDIILDMNPLPPYIQVFAAGTDGTEADLVVTAVGSYQI